MDNPQHLSVSQLSKLHHFGNAVRELLRDFHVKADPYFVTAVLKSAMSIFFS
jgi:hypothetical protein